MREIKFRYTAIRESGYIFSAIFSLEQIEAGEAALWFEVNHIGENTKVFREQFTGLKDKNGVEIYEGDIIDAGSIIGEIVFNDCGFMFRKKKYEYLVYNFKYFLGVEIVGNIHENPELLK